MVCREGRKVSAAFLDDVVIFSRTWADHLRHIWEVLRRLRQAGLMVKPKKCYFTMLYLGHIVGGGQVYPEASKVEAVWDLHKPNSKTRVRSLLGLTGYYRKYIPNYAQIAEPLTRLTKKTPRQFVWSEDSERAFTRLKEALQAAPVLRSPDYQKMFILQTDASQHGLGALLSQRGEDGEEHPVTFVSRKLLPREQRYAAVEKECLAIVWAIQSLRVYLFGRAFCIQTDHHPLQWLQRMKNKNMRLTRWSLVLQPYKFVIVHRRGQDNANADSLFVSSEGGEKCDVMVMYSDV